MDRTQRRERMDKVLRNFTSLRGVIAASVVDADGLTIALRNQFELDADAMSASVQIIMEGAKTVVGHIGTSEPSLVMTEFKGGILFVAPLTRGFLLTVVCDAQAMLGTVRYELKESVPELVSLI